MKPSDLILFAKVCSESSGLKASIKDYYYGFMLENPDRYGSAVHLAYAHMKTDTWPKFWEHSERDRGGSPRHNGVPWPLAIIVNLVKNGISYTEALHMPEAQAIWLSAGFSISDGATMDIFSSEDEALLDELAKVEKPN